MPHQRPVSPPVLIFAGSFVSFLVVCLATPLSSAPSRLRVQDTSNRLFAGGYDRNSARSKTADRGPADHHENIEKHGLESNGHFTREHKSTSGTVLQTGQKSGGHEHDGTEDGAPKNRHHHSRSKFWGIPHRDPDPVFVPPQADMPDSEISDAQEKTGK